MTSADSLDPPVVSEYKINSLFSVCPAGGDKEKKTFTVKHQRDGWKQTLPLLCDDVITWSWFDWL